MNIRTCLSVIAILTASQVLAEEPTDDPDSLLEVIIIGGEVAAEVPNETAEAEPPRKKPSSSRLIEEIVVTAHKREENLQDVPVSIQAFSGEMLDAMGVTDQTDLQRITPGLSVTNQITYVMTFLRGVGTDAAIAAEPSVATYIDGIYYPFASNLAQNFGAVDRIEVLKGPQGTLFGRNATGGAISIHTREPDFEEFHGELMADFGSFGSNMYRAYANLPVGENFGFNLSAVYSETDGYYSGTHATPPRPMHGDEVEGYRLKFRAQPTDNLDIRLAAVHMEMSIGANGAGFNSNPSLLGRLLGIQPQPGYEGSLDTEIINLTDPNNVYYGSLEYKAPWFDFKIIGSDQRMDTRGTRDFDGSPQPLTTFNVASQFIDAQSREVQLLSNDEWGLDWLEWTMGYFQFESVMGFGSLNVEFLGINPEEGRALGISLPPPLVDLLNPALNLQLPAPGLGVPTGAINLAGLIGTDSRAYYAQTTFMLTNWLDLTLGARHQIEERFIVQSTLGLNNADGTQTQIIDNSNNATDSDGNPYPARDTQEDTSPAVSLQLRPFGDNTMFYLSWQEAVKSATYNTISISEQPDYVEPEEIEAIELGVKTSFLDGLIRLNAAAFEYDLVNLQTYYLSILSGGVLSFQNAARASIKGVEFDGMAILFPSLVDDLVILGGAAYLDTEYLDFTNASGFDDNGIFQENQDYTGNQIMRTPEITATLSLSKTWQVPGGPFEMVVDAYHTDDFFYEASNREASRQESYQTYGLRLSYLYEDWGLRATAGLRNLTDESYTAGFFATDYGVLSTLAPPRSFNFQLIWKF